LILKGVGYWSGYCNFSLISNFHYEPYTSWLTDIIQQDANGFILTGSDLVQNRLQRHQGWSLDRHPFLLETDIPGIFAAGYVRHGSIKRIAAGVGEGSTAIPANTSIFKESIKEYQ
jgi:thioredoxin reductase